MLREPQGARRYNDKVTLTYSSITTDDYGHKVAAEPVAVADVYASVRQLSATKTALTFQQADIVGLEIEFRAVNKPFNGLLWRGRSISFSQPEDVGNRGRIVKITGYYQIDNPI